MRDENERFYRDAEAARRLMAQADEVRRFEEHAAPFRAAQEALRLESMLPPSLPVMPEIPKMDGHLASGLRERLTEWIQDFESTLDPDHEVGARLVSFGETLVFHIDAISWWNPSLIRFDGIDDNGDPVQLIQHVSQISVLLLKLPKQGPVARRIGFSAPHEPGSEPDSAPPAGA
jgi:hypothetical protein